MLTDISQKIPKYYCENCKTKTGNKKDYERHLATAKHQNNTSVNKLLTNVNSPLTQISPNNICCDFICNQLIKQNDEFKHLLVEQSKAMIEQNKTIIELSKNSSITNNTNTTHTNSHNKTFNLQFFLNETCKDAMNIMDFVDSIKLQLCDLENVGKLGYVDGISKIIVQNLNSLDETKRPVHCTDSKREVMYVKDEDKWEKENENKQKMRKVIKHVTHKNSKLLKEFKTKHPGCEKSESKYSDKYDKLIIEAMGGKGDNDVEKEDKIIKNIAKNVTIDKYNP